MTAGSSSFTPCQNRKTELAISVDGNWAWRYLFIAFLSEVWGKWALSTTSIGQDEISRTHSIPYLSSLWDLTIQFSTAYTPQAAKLRDEEAVFHSDLLTKNFQTIIWWEGKTFWSQISSFKRWQLSSLILNEINFLLLQKGISGEFYNFLTYINIPLRLPLAQWFKKIFTFASLFPQHFCCCLKGFHECEFDYLSWLVSRLIYLVFLS